MLTNSGSTQRVTPHGKFLSRAGQKFFFKAMRLDDVGATLDFAHKLKLRKRLDDLRASHTTGLVLTEANSQPCLDLAAQSGLVAMVELRITADELTSRRGWKSVVSRIAHTANIFAIASCPRRFHPRLRDRPGCPARRRTRKRATAAARRREDHQGTRDRCDCRHKGPPGNPRPFNPRTRFSLRGNPGARARRASRFRRRLAQPRRSAAGGDRIQSCIAGAGRSGGSGVWHGCGWRGCSARSCSGFSRLAGRAHDARVGGNAVRHPQWHLPAAAHQDADGVGGDLRLRRRAHDARLPRVAAAPRLPQFRGGHRR